jgi:hypothetical protein
MFVLKNFKVMVSNDFFFGEFLLLHDQKIGFYKKCKFDPKVFLEIFFQIFKTTKLDKYI